MYTNSVKLSILVSLVILSFTISSYSATPTAPANFHIAGITASSISLAWDSVAGATSYDIEKDGVIADNKTAITFTHIGLTSGTQHTYRIRTKNTSGTSAWSTQLQATVAVSVLSSGAKGDGITDDTKAIRDAAAKGLPLWFPKVSVHYRVSGYIQILNSVYGENRPEIRMYGSNGNPDQGITYTIFLIRNYSGSGLVIDGLHLNGGWDGVQIPGQYPPQWAHCIRVDAPAKNVTIQNCWLEKPIGDCICVSWYQPAPLPPDNILIQHCKMVGPFRGTVVIIGGTNVLVRHCYHEKMNNYVAPMIDFECDPLGFQYTRNITLENNVLNASRQSYGMHAITCANPAGNPQSGPVKITGLRGSWFAGSVHTHINYTAYAGGYYGDWGGGGGFTASDNIQDGKTAWDYIPTSISQEKQQNLNKTGKVEVLPKTNGLEVMIPFGIKQAILKAFTIDGRTAGTWEVQGAGRHFLDCELCSGSYFLQLTGSQMIQKKMLVVTK